jgi:hypothetical protein
MMFVGLQNKRTESGLLLKETVLQDFCLLLFTLCGLRNKYLPLLPSMYIRHYLANGFDKNVQEP